MRFDSPWLFLLLALVPLIVWLRSRRAARRGTVRFSSTENAALAGRSWRQRLAGLPFWLRIVALVLLIIALARPQMGRERIRDVSKGIAIEMVVDRSSSMGAEVSFRGRQLTRLDAVKTVFEEFVTGGPGGLEGRPNDLVGMVAFARYADTICPLTLAHGALSHFLESVKLVTRRSEDGTAIGDAIALAAARLETAEKTLAEQAGAREGYDDYTIKSKIKIGRASCRERVYTKV